MYISRIHIKNFRGINDLQLDLSPEINIIIGENGSCKSAFIDAIRLLYNIGEPIRDITINLNDFYESIQFNEDGSFVINRAKQIKITYEFRGLSNLQKGAFYEYLVIDKDDDTNDLAKIEIQYEDIGKEYPQFSFSTGGIEGQRADYNTFNLFQHYYLSALRDSTRDLTNIRGNILGKVIKRNIDRNNSGDIIKGIIKEANEKLLSRDEVTKTRDGVNTNLHEIFKEILENQIGLHIEQSKIEYIVNSIKPYLPYDIVHNSTEGFQLSQNSLGFNNLIYIATVLGDIKERILDDKIPHFVLLIEEPESHLHPQLQLSLYNFLKKANSTVNSQLFITTHSPTLTSKVPFENLILLDKIGHRIENCFLDRENEFIIFDTTSNAPISKEFVFEKKRMLERHIDVTKSQLFFAKSCLFIEGISEELLITAFCKILEFVPEDYRIELVNVDGTSFHPFLLLFNSLVEKKKLPQKIVVLTDDDRYTDSKKSRYSLDNLIADDYLMLNELYENIRTGSPSTRVANLISARNGQANIEIKTAYKTLEYALCRANIPSNKMELQEKFLFKFLQSVNNDKTDKVIDYLATLPQNALEQIEQDKIALLLWKCFPAKAVFAQNFSLHILNNLDVAKVSFTVPNYITEGLNFLK
jgi:putative ATP-dependent endonuclease of the OLD family